LTFVLWLLDVIIDNLRLPQQLIWFYYADVNFLPTTKNNNRLIFSHGGRNACLITKIFCYLVNRHHPIYTFCQINHMQICLNPILILLIVYLLARVLVILYIWLTVINRLHGLSWLLIDWLWLKIACLTKIIYSEFTLFNFFKLIKILFELFNSCVVTWKKNLVD